MKERENLAQKIRKSESASFLYQPTIYQAQDSRRKSFEIAISEIEVVAVLRLHYRVLPNPSVNINDS